MAFTDDCDLYGAVHEDGFNRAIRQCMEQRPVYFNFGTEWVAEEWRERLCCPPEVSPLVEDHSNPVVWISRPLPVLGTGGAYSLDWAAQIAELSIDFHDTDRQLPPELGGQLQPQQLSLYARICAGIGCPTEEAFREYPPPPQPPIRFPGDDNPEPDFEDREQQDPVVIQVDTLTCFELELYATAHAEIDGPTDAKYVQLVVDGIEIVDVEPNGLEEMMECYLMTLMRWVVMPRLKLLLPVFIFDLPLSLGSVSLKPATTVPHNPAVEDDELKAFINMEVSV